MVDSKKQLGLICTIAFLFWPAVEPTAAKLSWLEQIEVETFAELREVERFQLKAAEGGGLSGDEDERTDLLKPAEGEGARS